MRHDYIDTGDADSFAAIQDRNGEVVLGYCRRCRKGEGELDSECLGATADTITDEQIRGLKFETMESVLASFGTIKPRLQRTLDVCDLALGLAVRFASTGMMQRREARAACAEILNARSAK